jgi:hypothetical protein
MDVATAGGRKANRSRASDSPAPGESRTLEQPGQTKNTEEFDDGFEVEGVRPRSREGEVHAPNATTWK